MHPILVKLGFLEIRYYGLMYAIGILIAIQGITRWFKRKKYPVDEDTLVNIILWTFVSAIVGARLYYVLFNLPYYLGNPTEIFAVWHGGLAIHGGIIGGLLSGYFLAKKAKIRPWFLADAAAPFVILGQALGRFGNFMNGDAHGIPTKMSWGVIFPAGTPAGDQFPGIPTHPTMIYELILNLIAFVILYRLREKKYKDGFIFAVYIICYAINRTIVSFFRADDLLLYGLNMPHIISAVMIGVSIYFILVKKLYRAQ
jgi:phosphatidylglycerol:prolipoprotein diacylglycerol transferase